MLPHGRHGGHRLFGPSQADVYRLGDLDGSTGVANLGRRSTREQPVTMRRATL